MSIDPTWPTIGENPWGTKLLNGLNDVVDAVNNSVQYTDGQVNITPDDLYTKPYDTDLWVAGPVRTDPVESSQGIYVQHRVSGDLGGFVNDAAASELRIAGASNTGAGQSAHENSLVITDGSNDINLLVGVLANFHTSGSPTGTVDEVSLFRASQVPTLPGGLTITRVTGIHIDPQIVGTENFSIYAADGKSVFGPIVPKDINSVAGNFTGLSGQVSPVLTVKNSGSTTVFAAYANATAGVGGNITGASFYINNNLATTSTVALRVRAISGQSSDIMQVQDSTGASAFAVGSTGSSVRIIGASASLLLRNAADSGTYFSLTTGGPRWNDAGLQQTTVGAAGAASALPGAPTKYLKVVDNAGTTLVIPAYAAS